MGRSARPASRYVTFTDDDYEFEAWAALEDRASSRAMCGGSGRIVHAQAMAIPLSSRSTST